MSDKSLYENGNEQGTQIIKAYSKAVLELMHKMGVSNNVAQQRLNNCLKLDAKIAKYMPSSESAADMSNIKNVSAKKVTKEASSEINIVKMINDVCPKKVNKFLISDQNTLKNYNKIFDLNDINEIKDWTYVSTLIQNADNLSPEFQNIVNNLYNKILGVNAKRNLKDSAFEKKLMLASHQFLENYM
ncbi:hypothetical protein [Apilactobacillus ozensis]|uniref:hypothetical protein n=1 Tax=Apilactobacillus ozensis TaxID=866801 RepID=UPI0006D2A6EA|nr:hypothetical protein [Apilactobacillus ozensis]